MKNLNFIAFLIIFSLFIPSCKEESNAPSTLYVKFTNDAASPFAITNIQLLPRGKAGETSAPGTNWSANILTNGKKIAPGQSEYFTLEIPNLNWSQYRLGVERNGIEVMLHTQEGYISEYELPITHWGSDQRSVSVTLRLNTQTNNVEIAGYSDFAGISK
jgi:hypothetical protein